ncbi:MAG TPA: hypothetical protein VFX60_17435 [Micromonospora sp.]|nr:hypothetical protein [Micromonospora sp.]
MRSSTNPAPRAAAGIGVVDGQVYLTGGCTDSSCGRSNSVVRYNPATDVFTTMAAYPTAAAYIGCGAVDDKVYCAGGFAASAPVKTGFVYSPAANAWSGIADLPVDLWASGAAAANGMLLLSGGVINNSTAVTNQGWAYDPAANSWSTLPNSNYARYRGGAACGFAKIGGSSGGFNPTTDGERLPGFDQCSTVTDVPWLSASSTSATLQPGQSVTVTVTMDATTAVGVLQPGVYSAQFGVKSDTPYTVAPIDVKMTAQPPKDWGKLTGVVTGVDCRGQVNPVAGAIVQVNSKKGWTVTLKAGTDGRYAVWAPKDNPVEVIAARDGWIPQTRTVNLKAGETTTVDFALSPPGGTC